ncbi:MAG: SprB repeat-containing protein [Marinilabiliales bacterium]|nr:SprB repeat-containing protein [Marinilabiliales bacterium]
MAQLNVNVNGGEAPYSFSWLPVAGLIACKYSESRLPNPLLQPPTL